MKFLSLDWSCRLRVMCKTQHMGMGDKCDAASCKNEFVGVTKMWNVTNPLPKPRLSGN